MVREHGLEPVRGYVLKALLKCANQLEINYSRGFMETLADDLLDVYTHDSVEDITECLKRGRQGKYGLNYGKFNMIIIQEWMSKHLEEKSAMREKELSNQKKEESDFDVHEAYIKMMDANDEKKKKPSDISLIMRADAVIQKLKNKQK